MTTITAFGDSVLKGVIYEDDHYKVADTSLQKICEESLGIVVENKARFGSTITRGETIFERHLDTIRASSGEYVVLEFGGNDCDFNWKEVSEDPEREHIPASTIENFVETYTNIIREIKSTFPDRHIYGLIGGLHLFNKSDEEIRRLGKDRSCTVQGDGGIHTVFIRS